MMHILHHLVFSFSQCFSFEIMYIRFLTMYKIARENSETNLHYKILGIFLTKKLIPSSSPLCSYSEEL